MQLTSFDRWLREKFVYETHIRTLRPPEMLPRGIRVVKTPEAPGVRYKHLFVAKSSKLADQLITELKRNSQMYTTQVVDKKAWYVPFIAPKGKSITWWVISLVFISVSVISVLTYVASLAQDPEFQKNFAEALEIMKG